MNVAGKIEARFSSASCACRDVVSAECNVVVAEEIEEEQKVKGGQEEEAAVDGDDDEADDSASGFVLGPLVSLKEQLEKDKDDESLRRWKEKLLGCIDGDLNGQVEPTVEFQSLSIVSDGHAEDIITLPIDANRREVLFTLKEGSTYCLKLTFSVQHNIVAGLAYSNTVWKGNSQALDNS